MEKPEQILTPACEITCPPPLSPIPEISHSPPLNPPHSSHLLDDLLSSPMKIPLVAQAGLVSISSRIALPTMRFRFFGILLTN